MIAIPLPCLHNDNDKYSEEVPMGTLEDQSCFNDLQDVQREEETMHIETGANFDEYDLCVSEVEEICDL